MSEIAAGAVAAALDRGLGYLARAQRASGEWPTLASPHLDLRAASAYPKSPYVTSFVVNALAGLAPNPSAAAMIARAAGFLRAEREDDGSWHYECRGHSKAPRRIPADLDDTSCATAALAQAGERPGLPFFALLWANDAGAGGPYYTWLGVNDIAGHPLAREIDPLVNANIVFCLSVLGHEAPGAAAYLCDVAARAAGQRASGFSAATIYESTPHFLLYCLARAAAACPAMAPARDPLRRALLAGSPAAAPTAPALHDACVAAALLACGAERAAAAPYLARLLAAQDSDGGWPAWAAWRSFRPDFDGAPALTAALALDALSRFADTRRVPAG